MAVVFGKESESIVWSCDTTAGTIKAVSATARLIDSLLLPAGALP
jgi:hypothetical protein